MDNSKVTGAKAKVIRLIDLPEDEFGDVADMMKIKLSQYPELGNWYDVFCAHYYDCGIQCYLIKVGTDYIPAFMFFSPVFSSPGLGYDGVGECVIIWVAPEHRRKGYGRLLVNTVEFNFVRVSNIGKFNNEGFWKAMGFVEGPWKGLVDLACVWVKAGGGYLKRL